MSVVSARLTVGERNSSGTLPCASESEASTGLMKNPSTEESVPSEVIRRACLVKSPAKWPSQISVVACMVRLIAKVDRKLEASSQLAARRHCSGVSASVTMLRLRRSAGLAAGSR